MITLSGFLDHCDQGKILGEVNLLFIDYYIMNRNAFDSRVCDPKMNACPRWSTNSRSTIGVRETHAAGNQVFQVGCLMKGMGS